MKDQKYSINIVLTFNNRYLHFEYLIHKKKETSVIEILLESISFH